MLLRNSSTFPTFFSFLNSNLMYLFFFNDTATTEIYTLSLHDALPISVHPGHHLPINSYEEFLFDQMGNKMRSEEHTSELQSHSDIVCRLLLEKKNEHKLTPYAAT